MRPLALQYEEPPLPKALARSLPTWRIRHARTRTRLLHPHILTLTSSPPAHTHTHVLLPDGIGIYRWGDEQNNRGAPTLTYAFPLLRCAPARQSRPRVRVLHYIRIHLRPGGLLGIAVAAQAVVQGGTCRRGCGDGEYEKGGGLSRRSGLRGRTQQYEGTAEARGRTHRGLPTCRTCMPRTHARTQRRNSRVADQRGCDCDSATTALQSRTAIGQ